MPKMELLATKLRVTMIDCEDDEYDEREDDYDTFLLGLEYGIVLLPITGRLLTILGLLIIFRGASSRTWTALLILALGLALFPLIWERAYIYAQTQNSLEENYNVSSLDEYEEKNDREDRNRLEFGLDTQALAFKNVTQLTLHSLPGILLVLLSGAMLMMDRRNTIPVEEDIPPLNSL